MYYAQTITTVTTSEPRNPVYCPMSSTQVNTAVDQTLNAEGTLGLPTDCILKPPPLDIPAIHVYKCRCIVDWHM